MNKFAISMLLMAIVTCLIPTSSSAQDFRELNLVQLETQLNAILKTRLPEERLYIATVLKLVKDEKLPRKLINTSFKYVRKKRPYTKYPFVYFARVLHFQAKRDRIAIPEFDFTIYSERR